MADPPEIRPVPFAPGWRIRGDYAIHRQVRDGLWWIDDDMTLAEGRGTTERDALEDYWARLASYLTAVESDARRDLKPRSRRKADSRKLFAVLLRFFARTDPTLF